MKRRAAFAVTAFGVLAGLLYPAVVPGPDIPARAAQGPGTTLELPRHLTCNDARIWTDQTHHSCLQQTQICTDGDGACVSGPRIWTQDQHSFSLSKVL